MKSMALINFDTKSISAAFFEENWNLIFSIDDSVSCRTKVSAGHRIQNNTYSIAVKVYN